MPQTVGVGGEHRISGGGKTSDPKVLGIVANGYPTRSLEELGLENKYQGYYATKMALWCYLLSNWDINNLKVNSSLTGVELQRAPEDARRRQRHLCPRHGLDGGTGSGSHLPPDRDTAYRSPLTAGSTSADLYLLVEDLGV